MEQLSRKRLETLTEYFWEKKAKDDCWELYLEKARTKQGEYAESSLLAYEMAYAQVRKDPSGEIKHYLPVMHPNTTLVILVGDSFEPLFQSIWAHNPKRLVPVVNKTYPAKNVDESDAVIYGREQWGKIRGLLRSLLQISPRENEEVNGWQLNLNTLPEIKLEIDDLSQGVYTAVKDDPKAIFEHLHTHLKADLLNPDCQVVVDITGAKKTMVAGAFILAAYSNSQICYIDTDRHDENGRSYGYSCHFRTVSNPIKELSLRNWDKIGQLYDQYDFASALNLIPEDEEITRAFPQVEYLRHYLSMCQLWELGQLTGAWKEGQFVLKKLKQESNIPIIPSAVEYLNHCLPPSESSKENDPMPEIFKEPRNIVIYAQDELARINRLQTIKLSNRDAFSRAYAVYETLFKARVLFLYTSGKIQVLPVRWDKVERRYIAKVDGEKFQHTQPLKYWYKDCLKACIHMQTHSARDVLKGKEVVVKNGKKSFRLKWVPVLPLQPLTDEMNPGKELREKRNEITHSYVPVTNNNVEDVLSLAKSNFANYLDQWVSGNQFDEEGIYCVPDWDTIKKIFDLSFIPVQSQNKKGERNEQ